MVMTSYHYTLGVGEDANGDDIKLAYRRLARHYHPDFSKEKNSSEKFIAITEAYRALLALDTLNRNAHKVEEAKTQQANAQQANAQSVPKPDRTTQAESEKASEPDCEITANLSVEELYWGVEFEIDPSTQCAGRRYPHVKRSRLLRVKIKRGTPPGQRFRLPPGNKGNNGEKSDVYVTIRLKPHERYDVVGNTLYVDMPLSSWEARSGAIIDVVTPGGRVEVDVPAGMSSGQSIRIPARGLAAPDQRQGDLFAVARVVDVALRTHKTRQWPHIPHTDVKRWRPVGPPAGNTIDTFV